MLLGFLALAVLDSINPSAIGVTVTAMELPTAVPYFGAIALLTTADLPMARWLPLLVLYNAIFILPPVLLLVGHIVFGRRLDARYADLKERLQAGARETMLWIAGLLGGGLLVSSVVEYIARFGWLSDAAQLLETK